LLDVCEGRKDVKRRCAVTVLGVAGVLMMAAPPAAVRGEPSSQQERQHEESLQLVMERAVVSATAFERNFAAVVAEEHFKQEVSDARFTQNRVTRSDFLLVRLPGRDGWVPFRDVFEVDGRAVRDRSERLEKLFLDTPQTALTDANRISEESSRYNIGPVVRTINVPTFALILLKPAYLKRFEFSKRDDVTISGVRTWRVQFVERSRPTVVRTRRGEDVRIEGSLWIDPISGRLLKTLVKTFGTPDPPILHAPIKADPLMLVEVTYALSDAMGMWVPETMTEWVMNANRVVVTGIATYTKLRRFDVKTIEDFQVPQ
jgi:hypothetical protein